MLPEITVQTEATDGPDNALARAGKMCMPLFSITNLSSNMGQQKRPEIDNSRDSQQAQDYSY